MKNYIILQLDTDSIHCAEVADNRIKDALSKGKYLLSRAGISSYRFNTLKSARQLCKLLADFRDRLGLQGYNSYWPYLSNHTFKTVKSELLETGLVRY